MLQLQSKIHAIDDHCNIGANINAKFLLSLWAYRTSSLFSWALSKHKYFISFTKQELKAYILLAISSEMKFLLEIIIFLTMVTCFAWSIDVKSASIEVANTESIYIKDVYTETTYIWVVRGTCIETVGIKNINIKDICSGSAYTGAGTCFREA